MANFGAGGQTLTFGELFGPQPAPFGDFGESIVTGLSFVYPLVAKYLNPALLTEGLGDMHRVTIGLGDQKRVTGDG